MTRTGLLFCLLAIFALTAFGQAPKSVTAKADTFKELVSKLKGGDTNVNFRELRIASADSNEKDAGEVDGELRQAALEALNAKNYKEAAKKADDALRTGYVDLDSHLIAALANRELGDAKRHEFHKAVYQGLLTSILEGANGESPKTAFVVVSVGEEYSVLRALGLKRGSQALYREGGHTYDVLTVTDAKTNETKKVYFNIDIVWAGYNKMFK